jgi:hypothetical protein
VTVDSTIGSNMWQDCVVNQDLHGYKLPKPCCPAYLLLMKGNPEMDALTESEQKTFQDFVDAENSRNPEGAPFQSDTIFRQTRVGAPARPEGSPERCTGRCIATTLTPSQHVLTCLL